MQQMSDNALLNLARGGSVEALEILITRHHSLVYYQCLSIIFNAEDAADIAQQVFSALLSKARSYRGDNFTGWLRQVAKYECLTFLRSRKRRSFHEDEAAKVKPTISAPFTSSVEEQEAIQSVLQELPEEERQVLLLSDSVGLSHQEISAELEIPPGTVASRLSRAREHFREVWYRRYGKTL